MNTDELGAELKQTASSWRAPDLDAATVRDLATAQRRNRVRVLAGAVSVVAVAGAVAVAAQRAGTTSSSPQAHHATHARYDKTAPGQPISAQINALGSTGTRTAGQLVLARIPTGKHVTIHARLSFRDNAPGRVRNTAIVVTRPGTQPAAAANGTDNYYRPTRVAISSKVNATSPQRKNFSVTIPPDLPAGTYPVLTVIRTVLLPGQTPGLNGPYRSTSELGVVIVTQA